MKILNKLYEEILQEDVGDSIFVDSDSSRAVNIIDQPGGGEQGDLPSDDDPEDENININDDNDDQPQTPQDDNDDDNDNGDGDNSGNNGSDSDDSDDENSSGNEGEGDDNDDKNDGNDKGNEGDDNDEGNEGNDKPINKGKWNQGKQQLRTHDVHNILDKAIEDMKKKGLISKEDAKAIEDQQKFDAERLAESIRNRAKELQKRMKSAGNRQGGNEQSGGAGIGGGDSYFDAAIEKLYEPCIDWSRFDAALSQVITKSEKEIRRFKIIQQKAIKEYQTRNVDISKNQPDYNYSRSLYNPLNRDLQGEDDDRVIFQGEQFKDINIKLLFLITLDTSGSVSQQFYDIAASEAKGLLDHINTKFGRSKDKNAIYFMSWSGGDSEVIVKHFNNLNADSFKIANYQGGTDPTSIFHYILGHMKKDKSGIYKMNLMKVPTDKSDDDDQIIPTDKSGQPMILPFVLTITDGQFFTSMNNQSILPYTGELTKNIWWLVLNGSSEMCYPKNIVEFINKKV